MTERQPQYEDVARMSVEQVEAAIVRDDPEELLVAVLAAALYSEDPSWAQRICVALSQHKHFNVRGNAMLGFGHLARIHGALDESVVAPVVRSGLRDPHEYVRGQAGTAAEDIEQFLGWQLERPSGG
jgi:hypothetical protein